MRGGRSQYRAGCNKINPLCVSLNPNMSQQQTHWPTVAQWLARWLYFRQSWAGGDSDAGICNLSELHSSRWMPWVVLSSQGGQLNIDHITYRMPLGLYKHAAGSIYRDSRGSAVASTLPGLLGGRRWCPRRREMPWLTCCLRLEWPAFYSRKAPGVSDPGPGQPSA